ncbi:MAG: DUF1565 domain-containing protein, partial [Candidatus Stygibacter australis]|nr:DUF1565 domain-containing protein [Candidatus Stygibacter australis]
MKHILCYIIIFIGYYLPANIIEVIQDGSGDHTNISDAMEEAVDGDTVLVYPGTYYEYVNYDSKLIVLGSLYMTTGNREYIHNTIIDGEGERGCVVVHFGEPQGTKLSGFTLQHGNGWVLPNSIMAVGGALNISNGNILIDNCIIEENKAIIGGGLFIGFDCTVELKGCTIRKNWAMIEGGGIGFVNGDNSIIFNETDRCSIYNNRSGFGSDICSKYEGGEVEVYLDTIACEEYSGYYAVQYDYLDGPGIIWDGFTLEAENYWMEQTDADLYVASWGDDENSGLSANDPLKSITWASYLIAANENDPHTINLAPGVYSQGETGEVFPFQPKSYVTIKGDSAENTIIDGEENTSFIYLNYSWGDIHIEDLRFINSGRSEQFSFFSITKYPLKFNSNILADLYLENLVLENNWCRVMMLIETHANVYMNNILVKDNNVDDTNCDIRLTVYSNEEQTEMVLQNITLQDNNKAVFSLLGRESIPIFIFNNISMYHNTKISDSNDIYNYSAFWIAFPM